MRRTLIVFAKRPVLGAVKSRLAADLGWARATAFHRHTLARTLRRLTDPRWETVLAVSPDRAVETHPWPPADRITGQGGGDLGRRMRRALAAAKPGPAVLVGTDIPDLKPVHVARAFALLGRYEGVLGPSDDGGYWLIGWANRRAMPALGGVRWSTEHALAETRAALGGERVAVMETVLTDVDTGADLKAWPPGQS